MFIKIFVLKSSKLEVPIIYELDKFIYGVHIFIDAIHKTTTLINKHQRILILPLHGPLDLVEL